MSIFVYVWVFNEICDQLANSASVFSGSAAQRGLWPPRFTRFLDHTQRRATVGRTALDE
jgi:hypothetical protein